jgi:ribosomal protein S18 acetylase RimI-like enzyme
MEEFLRAHEQGCVTACAIFLEKNPPRDEPWCLANGDGTIAAALLRSGGMLLPVFGGIREIPPPRFLSRSLLGGIDIHAVQGPLRDTELLEAALANRGCHAAEHRCYDLMALDGPPNSESPGADIPGLAFRTPGFADLEAMLPLQAGYEKEEVLPDSAIFNPVSCRLKLSSILSGEQSLVACLEGRIVGKINTNAASFTRLQIGGVYVLPECRGRGIGRRMTAAFAGGLVRQGRGLTLFVKKNNQAAQKIYRQVGFAATGDYRISYY